MAPQQALANTAAVGPATDVFALAVVAIELLTLRSMPAEGEPWWGAAMQRGCELRALLAGARADAPTAVWDGLARALHPWIAERTADASVLRAALRGALDASPALTWAPTLPLPSALRTTSSPPSATVSASGPLPTPTVWSALPPVSTTAPFSDVRTPPDSRGPRSVWIMGAVAAALVGVATAAPLASPDRSGPTNTQFASITSPLAAPPTIVAGPPTPPSWARRPPSRARVAARARSRAVRAAWQMGRLCRRRVDRVLRALVRGRP